MNEKQFTEALQKEQLTLTDRQLKQFEQYYELLVEWNKKMNLTAVTDREEVYVKHFYDSLTPAFYTDFGQVQTMVDVGVGAGFPSIPLKICFPHLRMTWVDSLKKRTVFLQHVIQELDLAHIQIVHERAEQFGHQKAHREQYDRVVARAVARLNVLAELCLPLVKKGGSLIAMKGAKGAEELSEAQAAISKLGGTVTEQAHFQLAFDEGERYLFFIEKQRSTPKKYPRKAGTPNKHPLT